MVFTSRNEFDMPIKELPVENVFTSLARGRICTVVKLLLLEKRVIIVGSLIDDITSACELLSSLIFPLRWNHLYIPNISMPNIASQLNNYKYPFLVGMPRFIYRKPQIQENIPKDSYIVSLDENKVCDSNGKPVTLSVLPPLGFVK